MHLFVVYDIENDNVRTKVSDALKDWGLDRIQYSVFFGRLSAIERKRLENHLNELLYPRSERDTIISIPLCRQCLGKSVTLGAERQLIMSDARVLLI